MGSVALETPTKGGCMYVIVFARLAPFSRSYRLCDILSGIEFFPSSSPVVSLFCNRATASTKLCTATSAMLYGNQWCCTEASGTHHQLMTNWLLVSNNTPNRQRQNQSAIYEERHKAVMMDATANARREQVEHAATTLTNPLVITLRPDDSTLGSVKKSYSRHHSKFNFSNVPCNCRVSMLADK